MKDFILGLFKKKKKEEIIIANTEDLNKLSKEELLIITTEVIVEINNITKEIKDMKKTVRIMDNSEIASNNYEFERRRLYMLYDTIKSVKDLIQKEGVNEFKDCTIYAIDDKVEEKTNKVISNCLDQVDSWLNKNNINNIKLKDYENIDNNKPIDTITK